jgi:hypothetical protein
MPSDVETVSVGPTLPTPERRTLTQWVVAVNLLSIKELWVFKVIQDRI